MPAKYQVSHSTANSRRNGLWNLYRKSRLPAKGSAVAETLDARLFLSAAQGMVYHAVNSANVGLSGVMVFDDVNANGQHDSGEASQSTASDGSYSLGGLSAGLHHIAVVTPTGYLPSSAQSISFSTSSATISGLDFNETPEFSPPSDLVGAVFTSNEIDLSWTNQATDGSYIEVDRSDGSSPYASIASLTSSASAYSDTSVSEGVSYSYEVRVMETDGFSPASNSVDVVTPPADPSDLSLVPSSPEVVSLSWTNHSSMSDVSYVIERSQNGGPYESIGASAGSSYLDDNPGYDGSNYRVHAEEGSTDSNDSNVVEATLFPYTITDFTVSPTGSSDILLSWTNLSTIGTLVELDRSEDGATYESLTAFAPGTTSYDDAGLSDNTQYDYEIFVLAPNANSAIVIASATTELAAPSDLTAAASGHSVSLSWTNHSSDPNVTFQITRDSQPIGSSAGSSYIDTDVSDGEVHTYVVTAEDGTTSSNNSNPATVTITPTAPTDVSAQPNGTTEVDVWWSNDPLSAGDDILIERCDSGSGYFTTIGTVAAGGASYADMSVSEGVMYSYELQTVANGSTSVRSASATVITPILAPSAFEATVASETEIDLSWGNDSTNSDAVVIERSTDGVTFTPLASLSATDTSYVDTGVDPGQTYWYEIRAQNSVATSEWMELGGVNTADGITVIGVTI